jgi:hypothetical protein
MARVLIKKFTLVRNGVRYTAGTVVDLPDDEAVALAKGSPKEFEVIDMPAVGKPAAQAQEQAAPVGVASIPEDENNVNLDKMNVAQLKKFAKDNGIDVGNASKKQELLDAIVAAAEPEKNGLPDIDAEALVK